jgi:ABC-type polysaccharide/polyol phosphate transport system ATPase subunit
VAVRCDQVTKRFYFYEHRTASLRELFIRRLRGRPLESKRAHFSLRDVSLDVRQGESLALIGRNGSGKSTVLRLMAGIYQPTEGVVETRGRLAAVIELGAGFHPELTGAENVRIYGAVMGFSPKQIAERFDDIVAFAELDKFMDVPIKYYSSGMQARLAFAVTVCVDPDILLVDEVLAVGDQGFRDRCIKRLESFQAKGGTLSVVTHDLESAGKLCERAVWLEAGQVRMDGAFDEVRRAYEESMA